jgi:hypothetical protein
MTRARARCAATAASITAALVLGGCGGGQRASGGEPGAPAGVQPAVPSRTPIERRRDAACEQLGPKLTACAVADAGADLAAGKIDQRQFEQDTAPAIQRKNTEEFEKACKGTAYSSRQVRVLEVCFQQATQCGPLLDCLGHLDDPPPGK